jgi:hypothetical protein
MSIRASPLKLLMKIKTIHLCSMKSYWEATPSIKGLGAQIKIELH